MKKGRVYRNRNPVSRKMRAGSWPSYPVLYVPEIEKNTRAKALARDQSVRRMNEGVLRLCINPIDLFGGVSSYNAAPKTLDHG